MDAETYSLASAKHPMLQSFHHKWNPPKTSKQHNQGKQIHKW